MTELRGLISSFGILISISFTVSGRATPLEMQLHYGLERSLSGNGSAYLNPYTFEARVGSPQSFRGSSVPPPDRWVQFFRYKLEK